MAFISNHTNLGLEVYLLFENTAGRIERVYSKGMEAYFLR
jgi:hypothetical protein